MKDISFLKNYKIAHRGIYDNNRIYENTLRAFSRAIKYKVAIEIDVRLLKDGTIIVFHDDDGTRMLHADLKIENMTYEELNYMSKYNIPTLSDVLELVHGTVPLLIEVKSKYKKGLFEAKICELLDNYSGEFAIQSFDIKTIKWFYKYKKDYIIGYLIGKRNSMKEYFFKKYDFINVNIFLYDNKKIKKMREDKLVLGYTIKNINEYQKYKDTFDNLIYDNILEISEVMEYNKQL